MLCSRLPGVGCRLHSVPCDNRLRREWSPPKCPEMTRDGVDEPDGPSTKGPERLALELAETTGPRTERPRLMASACGGFGLLCWTGIRCGELLALTPSDFMLETSRLRINRSYQSLHGVDTVTDPKMPKSVRTIVMPAFLRDGMTDFIELRDDVAPDERLFAVTKRFLAHEMEWGCKASGVKRIRIHDIRHSHVSLLIEMGFSALAIAERMGHEAVDITYRYAHLFPTKQDEMAAALDGARG